MVDQAIAQFLEGRFLSISLLYWEFASGLRQNVRLDPWLPFAPAAREARGARCPAVWQDVAFEPTARVVVETLLPGYVRESALRACRHSAASENAMRQASMARATENATGVITDLTRHYRRLRQDSITNEMLELVAGGFNGS